MIVPVVGFNAGELDPELGGRVDLDVRQRGCRALENFIPTVRGPAKRRGGTRYMGRVKNDAAVRLVPFEFNVEQAYVLEFGPQVVRFWASTGDSGGLVGEDAPYEVETPYTAEQIARLRFRQSADVLFIAHPEHPPRTLSRYGHTDWRLEKLPFTDGPYLEQNSDEAVKMAPGATTGSTVISVSGANEAVFQPSDVGRHLRLRHDDVIGWCVIDSVHEGGLSCAVTVKRDFGATTQTWEWRLGAWGDVPGWPSIVTFIDQSLAFASTNTEPQTHWKSESADIYSFAPTNEKGEVLDDSAYAKTLGGDKLNAISWMVWAQYLIMGTAAGEWRVVTPMNEPISPTNGTLRLDGGRGSAPVDPVMVGNETLFVQRQGRRLFGVRWSFELDGLADRDLTKLCRHLTTNGVKGLVFQRSEDVLWLWRTDGVLISMTYDPSEQVVAAARHVLGGKLGDGAPVVESAACIPGGERDELWLVVRRTLNGQDVRCVERLEPGFDSSLDDAQTRAFFVDCGMSYSGEETTEIGGLEHLEGETVAVAVDGAAHSERVVEGGKIVLDAPASRVHVGLRFISYLSPMPQEFTLKTGSSFGRRKILRGATVRVLDTLALSSGPDRDSLEIVTFRTTDDAMDQAVPLFSGDVKLDTSHGYEDEPQIWIAATEPLPMTVLAVFLDYELGG